jgi:hypothetical protein
MFLTFVDRKRSQARLADNQELANQTNIFFITNQCPATLKYG